MFQSQKHKKQPWSNVECFAFGDATVRFASLETRFHAANLTIPPPPSYEGYPLYPKDKNHSPFHGEKPLMIKWFLERRSHLPKTIFHGRDAILRKHWKYTCFWGIFEGKGVFLEKNDSDRGVFPVFGKTLFCVETVQVGGFWGLVRGRVGVFAQIALWGVFSPCFYGILV